MTEDTPTPPPAASDAIEAATMAVYDHRMPDGDALGVLLHESHYIDDSPPIAEQLAAVRDLCKDIARSAVAAYVAALPSEFGELKRRLDVIQTVIGYEALAAIIALEAKFEYFGELARLDHEQLVAQRDEARKQVAESAASAIRSLAAHEAAEKMANG